MAVRLRRHMGPQQHALVGLLSRLPAWVEQPEAARLRDAIERLGALGHDLDLVQERARLRQEQAAARLMKATNRNLSILSIVTAIVLPIELVSGIFGRNFGGLPALQDAMGFWYGIGLMVVVALVSVSLLRRLRRVWRGLGRDRRRMSGEPEQLRLGRKGPKSSSRWHRSRLRAGPEAL